MFRNMLGYRYFIFSAIKNDLVTRFVRSKLGALWVIFNPLAQVIIYALILSNVLAAKLPAVDHKFAFSIYLMSGTLGWALFSGIIMRSITLFVENAALIKKISFPQMTLPSIMLGSCILNNLILLAVILVIFALLGHSFNLTILYLIPLMGTIVILASGIGIILGVINVFIRDIGQVVPIGLQVLFWVTPIVYPVSIIPQKYMFIITMNPMFSIIEGYHQVLLYGKEPDVVSLVYLSVVGALILFVSLFIFRKASPEMVDVL